MKRILAGIFLLLSAFSALAQRPKNGTYTFEIAWAESGGKTSGCTCTVVVKGDSVKIIDNGSMTGKEGNVIIEGVIMKHKKTGKWIIGNNKSDVDAKEIGGCSDGPPVIDFKRKIWESC